MRPADEPSRFVVLVFFFPLSIFFFSSSSPLNPDGDETTSGEEGRAAGMWAGPQRSARCSVDVTSLTFMTLKKDAVSGRASASFLFLFLLPCRFTTGPRRLTIWWRPGTITPAIISQNPFRLTSARCALFTTGRAPACGKPRRRLEGESGAAGGRAGGTQRREEGEEEEEDKETIR